MEPPMEPTHHTSTLWRSTDGFTLIELTIGLAIVACWPAWLSRFIWRRWKEPKRSAALTEVVRLERVRFAETGTYTADLQELGFQSVHALHYTELFVEVHKDAKG